MFENRTAVEKKIWFLTVVMFASFFIFEMKSWGKYLFLLIAILIGLLVSGSVSGMLIIRKDQFQKRLLLFSFYCFVSALWAWIPSAAIQSGITVMEILLYFSILYNYYICNDNIELLLHAIKWGAYVVVIYTIISYGGFSELAAASKVAEVRLENSFSNVNELGMLASIACIIQVDEMYRYRHTNWQLIFTIPAIMLVAASQSRKAFAVLFIGITLIVILKSIGRSMSINKIFKLLITGIVALLLVFILFQTGLFDGTLGRIEVGNTSSSGNFFYEPYTLRGQYKLAGWSQFLKTPFLGIGIGSSTKMLQDAVGMRTYTHDNYIELLSCGGIVGFIIYYSMYVYLLRVLILYRKTDERYADICLVLLLLLLLVDTALVSYSSKERYFYLMLEFIEVSRINTIMKGDRYRE